jgi:hypothetical protein
MAEANTENINQAIELLKDLDAFLDLDEDLKDVIEFIPNDKLIVGLQFVCQFRDRENPDEVRTMRIEHGKPVEPLPDGHTYLSKADPEDFPPVTPFQIEPS